MFGRILRQLYKLINSLSDVCILPLTSLSGLHEVDEHIVDAGSLSHHQRLCKKHTDPRETLYPQCHH